MNKLLEANKIGDPAGLKLSHLDQTPTTVAFLAGELDALVFASAPESLMVQMLLQTPGVKLMDFSQSEAYSRRLPFLTPVLLPRGVVDLSRDLPPNDVRLVATTTALLARQGTHPALLQLFAQTAKDLHGPAGWFNRAGSFPNIEHSEYPVSREAERTIAGGQPFLQRWLPYWLANLVERMWLALGIIVAVAAAAVTHRPAGVPVPHPLARVPLVRAAARHREPPGGAAPGHRRSRARARCARRARGPHQRAAGLCGGALCASQQHRRGAAQGDAGRHVK